MAKQTIGIGSSANDGTGDTLRVAFDKCNDNFTELYNDDGSDVGSIIAGTGISVDTATGDVTVTNISPNATHTGDVTGSGALTIADNVVTHDKLENRYTASSSETSASTLTLDKSTADVFSWTAGHSVTVSFSNVKIGDTATLIVTGGGSSYTFSLSQINGGSATFNKVSGTYDDTSSTKNLIEFKFISTSEAWYQISQIAS